MIRLLLKRETNFLWGRDILIAPVYEKAAHTRHLYLPQGEWYDWWTNSKHKGAQTVTREVDLSIMPIYIKVGAIIPVDPVRQYTSEVINEPTTIKIYTGANGSYTLYDDDGISLEYLRGNYTLTHFTWDDRKNKLTIYPEKFKSKQQIPKRIFRLELIPQGVVKEVVYSGQKIEVTF